MEIVEIRRERLREWFSTRPIPPANKSYLSQLMRGKAPFGEKSARSLEEKYDMGKMYLDGLVGELPLGAGVHDKSAPHRRMADFELVSADDSDGETGKIEYWDARGSCGGGFLNYEQMPKGNLVKEATFFHRFNVKPGDLFAIYADGDSMADFIVDGDIVIFNRQITAPRSGKIYAIDHPDGLKIKILRRNIDGSWSLESKNADKRAFPDEHIPVDQLDLLNVHGEFIYRQGG